MKFDTGADLGGFGLEVQRQAVMGAAKSNQTEPNRAGAEECQAFSYGKACAHY